MKRIVITIILAVAIFTGYAQQKKYDIRDNWRLALTYYNAADYEKALPLLYNVYEKSRNETYFRYYISCMVKLKRYDEALEKIQKEIKKQRPPRPEYIIHKGYVLKQASRNAEAAAVFKEIIEKIPQNKASYIITGNAFTSWGEYDYARQTYLKGRKVLAPEKFSYELARASYFLHDYGQMLDYYLDLIGENKNRLNLVQNSLLSAMRQDIDNELRDKFREKLLKRIQSNPDITIYNRLLVWFFLQEKKFSSALRQLVALDRRTGKEDTQILQLGNAALNNHSYDDAQKAFDYLLKKGEKNTYYRQAYAMKIKAAYQQYHNKFNGDIAKGEELALLMKDGLNYLGYSTPVLNLIRDQAHLLAFTLNKPEQAMAVLNKGLAIPRLKPEQAGMLKTEIADINVFNNDPWEAMLIYSQVIEDNKKNDLGDEVKLKKAKLGYYMGNFSWAKAQLDVLKASTSKLTANDAMELSLMIGNNLNLDTTAIPLTMFARADLLFFQSKNQQAMVVLDSLGTLFPYNPLVDDILFRKAKIEIQNNNDTLAARYLEQIIDNFGYDLLGDDALFMLAELYNFKLNKKEEAKALYLDMLTRHPGSIFTEESRGKYRELRNLYPDKKTEKESKETIFMESPETNEF